MKIKIEIIYDTDHDVFYVGDLENAIVRQSGGAYMRILPDEYHCQIGTISSLKPDIYDIKAFDQSGQECMLIMFDREAAKKLVKRPEHDPIWR